MEIARRCHVDELNLDIATNFLHEIGVIRYFGDAQSREKLEVDVIDRTVFVDKCWIQDGLKGLFQRDRDSLMRFFTKEPMSQETRRIWMRLVQRLATEGTLHVELCPFLWPPGTTALSKSYWRHVGERVRAEFCKSTEDLELLLSLLGRCNVLLRLSDEEFKVPLLLAESHADRIDARAYSSLKSSAQRCFCLVNVAPGWFELLLSKCGALYSRVDHNSSAAALYRDGLKAQLFLNRDRISEKERPRPVAVLTCFTTTAHQLDEIEEKLRDVNSFFTGTRLALIRLHKACNIKSVVQVRIICSPLIRVSVETAAHMKQAILDNEAELVVDAGTAPVESERLRVVLVCVDNWLASSAKAQQQLQAAISQRVHVIPCICPGYLIANYAEFEDVLQGHTHYFDCRNMSSDAMSVFLKQQIHNQVIASEEDYMNLSAEQKEQLEEMANEERARWMQSVPLLIGRIRKCLREWRGAGTDLVGFKAASRVPCPDCIAEARPEPSIFERESLEEKFLLWTVAENRYRSEHQELGLGESDPPSCFETCSNSHRNLVQDLLVHATNYEAVPCPSCVEAKQLPPFCFSRENCLQHYSTPNTSLTCRSCQEAERRVILSPFWVLPPHVFISYQKFASTFHQLASVSSTQHLVASIASQLAQSSGLILFYEADKGSQTKSSDASAPHVHPALAPSRVFVLFLSDAYVSAEECVREYLSAIRGARYVIPVLAPDYGPIFDGGVYL